MSMWEKLGFRESPYSTSPLMARAEDVDLLVGRYSEGIELCTSLDSSSDGILVLSGPPGVGKTSFFNVQQYLLESELAVFGPKILAARVICAVQPGDDNKTIALRALDSLYKSVKAWCSMTGTKEPPQTRKVGKWLIGGSAGFDFGLDIMGFGGNIARSVELASVSDASFEQIADAISVITAEVTNVLGFKSAVIALDNLENFSDEQLAVMLMSFRDNLFSTEKLWWVLIGQSGLGSLIQAKEPRVFERITGSGIEVKPIELTELDEAISLRVTKFHSSGNGKSPLQKDTHAALFEASFGEMRFVFKYSNSICARFIEAIRANVLNGSAFKNMTKITMNRELIEKALDETLAEVMISEQIPHDMAMRYLKDIVSRELNGLSLKDKEKEVLHRIGLVDGARGSDFKDFSFRTMQDFSSNYLTKLFKQNLLTKKQRGLAVTYNLRGIARLAYNYDLLS